MPRRRGDKHRGDGAGESKPGVGRRAEERSERLDLGERDSPRAHAMPAEPANGPETTAADITEEIEGLRGELTELNDKWLRALADLDNYKKRMERDRGRWSEDARAEVLLAFLDVVDNFDRAVACEDPGSPPPDDPFRQGVELILADMKSVLAKYGVLPMETCGVEFDPNLHEAVGQVESGEHEPNQIVQEVRRGYMFGDRLLRCPRVIVAKD
jgi:molecular chaperone GrpE